MSDIIHKLGFSVIQHGPYNKRIYLMKPDDRDMPGILPALDRLAEEKGYEKILVKIPAYARHAFEEGGYGEEALIPNFFGGQDDALFMAKYLSSERRWIKDQHRIDEILSLAHTWKQDKATRPDGHPARARSCTPADAEEMSHVYKEVFETYPFPIFDPPYLIRSMKNHVSYFCLSKANRIVALAAAEAEPENRSVEMTDFATRSQHRGRGLANCLLEEMGRSMTRQGMIIAFSIARALSPAMNIVFAKNGYTYAGTLGNNTNIAGRIESMNVWYKSLHV